MLGVYASSSGTVPSVETVRMLVSTAEEHDPVLSAAIMLAALTGCRRGELLGLRWSDVNRDQMILHVQRSIKREEFGRALRAGPTKTHQDRRVTLDPVMLAVIDTHCQRAEAWAGDAGVTIGAEAYMLTEDPTGQTPMAPDTLTHRFSRLVAHLRVGSVRFHDLRHSVCTSFGAGYDLAIVAGRLGHRDPTVTLRVLPRAAATRSASGDHLASTVGAATARRERRVGTRRFPPHVRAVPTPAFNARRSRGLQR